MTTRTTTPDRTHPAAPTSDRSRGPSHPVASPQPWQAHRFAALLNAGDVQAFGALLAPDFFRQLGAATLAPPSAGAEGRVDA